MLIRILLFGSSYAPLFALLAIRFEKPWLEVLCLTFALLGIAFLPLLLCLDASKSRGAYRIVQVADAGSQAAGYVASYLLPFLTVSQPTIRDLVAYGIFLTVAGMVYVKTSLIQVNPLLYILQWRVFEVRDDRGFHGFLISRRRVMSNEDILATRFGDDVLVDRTVD